mmetsp:Transcript_17732/g.34951  ORF Transcript_17732/g.34951 Transcript_17732/m.34951 type:complete len:619 (+) Transcript_17732:153-2009(+)
MRAGVNRAAAGARDFFADGVLGGRRKQEEQSRSGRRSDFLASVKVTGILVSLLLMLFMLAYGMVHMNHETRMEEWQRPSTQILTTQDPAVQSKTSGFFGSLESSNSLGSPSSFSASSTTSNSGYGEGISHSNNDSIEDSDSNQGNLNNDEDNEESGDEDEDENQLQESSSLEDLDNVLSEDPDVEADELVMRQFKELAGEKVRFSSRNIPGVDPLKDQIFLVNGTLTNAYKSVLRNKPPRGRQDLPRVFPKDVAVFYKNLNKRRTVCVYTRTPRQDSLFRTNFMSMFGSGDYNYVIMRSTDCQHEGTCKSGEEARSHPRCNPDISPTIHLLERIKNFQHERFEQVLTNGKEYYDVLVATGDEFCRAIHTYDRAHFRMYAGPNVVNASLNSPIYLPLGPREEFKRVYANDVRLVKERKYMYNFMGSLTSLSRKVLVNELRSISNKYQNFVWVVSKWKKQLTRANGYITPTQYKQILIDSVFTLCPQGHNPEAYRIFEACEAGSIPVLVLDEYYRSHECESSFRPLITQGAPFVFLNSWEELPAYFDYITQHPERIQQMQMDTMEWYRKFMSKVANNFETVMTLRFSDRSEGTRFTSTASIPGLRTYLDDPDYRVPLQKN